jgi:hypothetical protein
MTLSRPRSLALGFPLVLALTHLMGIGAPAETRTPKRGGVLQTLLIEDPPGLLAHESATVSNVCPMSPCFKEYFAHYPHVKNLVPHNALYNYGRMQDAWLDR